MRHVSILLSAGLLILGLAVGCEQASTTVQSSSVTKAASGKVLICGKCGLIKGSELCCKKGQPLCPKCGLVKGSPGCCRVPKDVKGDVELCTSCGLIKGSVDCCKIAGKQICPKCGLVKGSPGCCRIK